MCMLTSGSRPQDVTAFGGAKGGNLCELTRCDIPVPRWAILGLDVFAEFLAASGIATSLDALLAEVETGGDMESLADGIRDLILSAAVSEQLRAKVAEAYEHVGAEHVAVRSSGVEEDGHEASFAGQFATYLHVSGVDEVHAKVLECWASAYSARSLHYRVQRGLPVGTSGIAVIVQEMVPAERSGVLFTANPVTGDEGEYLVSSVYGLGEGLVSGAVDADTLVLDAGTGEVTDTVLGEKRERVDAAAGSGCVTTSVPVGERGVLSVRDADLVLLREVGEQATKAFGGPQDIEWAIVGDQLWVLQARPVTGVGDGLSARSPEELTVAAENVADGSFRIWDNSNIVENFGDIVSPLTFSFAANVYTQAYRNYGRALRVPDEQLRQMEEWLPVMLGHFHGRVYYNLLHWYRMVRIAPVYLLNRKVLEVALGVAEPLPDEIAQGLYPYTFRSGFRRRVSRTVTNIEYTRRFLGMQRSVRGFVRYFYKAYEVFDNVDYDALPATEIYRRFRRLEEDLLARWGPMMTLDATLLQSIGALHLLTNRWLPDAPSWFQWSVASPGTDVESAEPVRALAELAEFVCAEPELRKLLAETSQEEIRQKALDGGFVEFVSAADDYVAKYGYRSPDELKLEVPDLREDPASLFPMVRDALPEPAVADGAEAGAADVSGESTAPKPDAAQEYLDEHLSGGPRRWLYEIVRRKTRRSLADRERLRFCRTRAFGAAKRMLRGIGRDLARAGVIDDWQDVFWLRLDEIRDVLEERRDRTEVPGLVAARKRQRPADEALFAPSRFTTHGADYGQAALEKAGWTDAQAAATGVSRLRGTPSCPGTAEGEAVVVTDPKDFTGGILVAYRTDPGWVSALSMASALVIERGSPLTHVAVVARELGVPTIVQIDGATRELRTGMRVRVDGSIGLLTVLDAGTEPESEPEAEQETEAEPESEPRTQTQDATAGGDPR